MSDYIDGVRVCPVCNGPTTDEEVEAYNNSDNLPGINMMNNINDPICGNCAKPYSAHYFEDEVFCNDYTNGDVFTDEPHDDKILEMLIERLPSVYDSLVKAWKLETGNIKFPDEN